jgi:hypothetical protein
MKEVSRVSGMALEGSDSWMEFILQARRNFEDWWRNGWVGLNNTCNTLSKIPNVVSRVK